MLHGQFDLDHMETVQPGMNCDSKDLPTNIPVLSHVKALREKDTEQNGTNHRPRLINGQAGFRPGMSCTKTLVNLTQHI